MAMRRLVGLVPKRVFRPVLCDQLHFMAVGTPTLIAHTVRWVRSSSRLEKPTDDAKASPSRKFSDFPLSAPTLSALHGVFGYTEMSNVQAQVLPKVLSQDTDFIIRAHTGTGKTLAFLIPIAEAILAKPSHRGVSALIISPTRELSTQIGKVAEKLFSEQKINVVTLIGGIPSHRDKILIRRMKPRVIVATPGRLLEHLERTFLFSSLFDQLDTLVLDEGDRLFQLGFLPEIKEIISYLPWKRRSMLFSATVEDYIMQIAGKTCRGNYEYIDCIGDEGSPTLAAVEQLYAMFPGYECLAALYNLMMNEMARDKYKYKIIVFFPTARLTAFMAEFFRKQLRIGVYEIHRRRDQDYRAATRKRFMDATAGILFSSDVSARGMDYPNVTLVIQHGAPATRDLYIHRIGRTARAGRRGRTVLLLNDREQGFLRAVEDLDIKPYHDADSLRRVNEYVAHATTSWISSAPMNYSAHMAFASLLVHYKSTHRVLQMSDDDVIQAAGDLLLGCGLINQPVITKRLAIMLGLANNPRIQCVRRLTLGSVDDDDYDDETLQTFSVPQQRLGWRG